MTSRFLTILLVLISHTSFAQSVDQQTDSLLNIIQYTSSDSLKAEQYFDAARLNLYEQPLKTIELCQEAIDISTAIRNYSMVSSAYVLMFNAGLYYGHSADVLLQVIKRLEDNVKTHLEEEEMIRVYWVYALYYENIGGQSDKEIEAYIKALELAKKYHVEADVKAGLMGNIGEVLLHQTKHLEALDYFEKSLAIATDDIAKGGLFHNIGRVYNYEERYDTAYTLFQQAYDFHKKGKDIKGMASALIQQGKYHDRKKEPERAKQVYLQTLELIEKNSIGSLSPLIFATLAEHHLQHEDYQKAIDYGERSLADTKQQQNYSDITQAYNILQESYAAVGNYQRAYEIRGEQLVYNDSVRNSELRTKVQALKTEFEVEQKETENELLKAEAATNLKTIQSKNTTALALLLGLLLLGSWAIVIFRSNQRKQRYNKQLEATVAERTSKLEKVNKDLAQANYELKTFNYIASHDIKEPIRNIGNYAGLIARKLPVELQYDFKEYFDNIKKGTTQLYTLVEDFSRYTQLSKNDSIDFQLVDLNTLLDNLNLSMSKLNIERNARIINKGLPSVHTNSSLIYIILKNIIENGLKFNQSNSPSVTLSSKEHEQYTEIFIKDNGIGIEPAYQQQIFDMFKKLHHRKDFNGSGIGLAIVKLLMDKLGAKIQLKSSVDQGSTFVLQIPKQHQLVESPA